MRRGLIILLGVILFGLAAAATVVLTNDAREAGRTLAAFLDGLNTPAGAGAEQYLALTTDQSDAFTSLLILTPPDAAGSTPPSLQRDVRVSPFGLPGSRAASVGLAHANGTTRLSFRLRRTPAGWRVTALPNLLAHPAAYSLNASDGTPTLLVGERSGAVAGGGLPAGDHVVFVIVLDGKVLQAQPATATPVSRLLRLRPGEFIETEQEGLLPLAATAALYDASGSRPTGIGQMIPGTVGLNAYYWRGTIYGLAMPKPFTPDRIRVLLNTTDFGGVEHRSATVSSDTGLTIRESGTGRTVTVGAGAVVTLRPVDVAGRPGAAAYSASGAQLARSAARLILTAGGSGRLTLHTVTRGFAPSRFSPAYRGRLEVAAALPPAGGAPSAGSATALHIINDLPLDEYLYSVVPSEMPVSYGVEALKVQALAARAYAVAAMTGGGYTQAGAHVDDSTSSQVYNNIKEQPASNDAVDATAGRVPAYEGKVVDARFFSTSCGFTANSYEVWSRSDGRFPGALVPYLVARPQTTAVTALPNEDAVRAFLRRTDLDAPDAGSPWFRWRVSFTRQEIEAAIAANLAQRQQAQPGFVLTRNAAGNFVAQAIGSDPLGTLTDIRVVERGAGGNIMTLEIAGTGGTYRIIKEYNIRMLLRPVQYLPGQPAISIALADGSSRANYGLLPSAFACFDIERDAGGAITRVVIQGGGNGHGAGMSQEGARGLAARGWTYDRIVAHYYPGAEIVTLDALFPR